jgi:nucleotide-binding universal stress UspA family protein
MVKHLLVPLEGNERAEAVLPTLHRLDALGLDEITLLRTEMPVAADEYAIVSDSALQQARAYLREVQERLHGLKAPVRILVRIGPATSTILETAREKNASMILVAMARRARLVRFLFGNVTEQLVQRSSIPVLAVPPPWSYDLAPPQPAAERPLRNLLVPLDGKRTSAEILRSISPAPPARACSSSAC